MYKQRCCDMALYKVRVTNYQVFIFASVKVLAGVLLVRNVCNRSSFTCSGQVDF